MPTNETVVQIYGRILGIIWGRLAPTFGQRTVAAIARNVVALERERFPVLQHLRVDEAGFHLEELARAAGQEPAPAVESALDSFLDQLFEALSDLIGRLIVTKVASQARDEASKGGDRK